MTFRDRVSPAGLPAAFAVTAGFLVGVFAPATSAGLAPGRDRLPVVLKGRHLKEWTGGVNLTQIYLYRYDPTASPPWIPIPYQIDKRRKVNFIHNVGAPGVFPSSTAHDCALSYFPPRYCSSWAGTPHDGTVQECPSNYQTSSPRLKAGR